MKIKRKQAAALAAAVAGITYTGPDSLEYIRGMNEMRHAVANNLADVCESNTSQFNRRKFIKACGVVPIPKEAQETEG